MYIAIEDLSEDRLSRIKWRFWLKDTTFVLDEYVEEHRDSTRKKYWEVDRIYSRLTNISRLYTKNKCMDKSEVEVTEEIKARIVDEFLKRVVFATQ